MTELVHLQEEWKEAVRDALFLVSFGLKCLHNPTQGGALSMLAKAIITFALHLFRQLMVPNVQHSERFGYVLGLFRTQYRHLITKSNLEFLVRKKIKVTNLLG